MESASLPIGNDDSLSESNLDDEPDRFAVFEEWVRCVRDPARLATEGLRQIRMSGETALAEYEVAPLPTGRWAMQLSLQYRCGDMRGFATAWAVYPDREACLAHFLEQARSFFRDQLLGSVAGNSQRHAQREIAKHLRGGLFGFLEPPPD